MGFKEGFYFIGHIIGKMALDIWVVFIIFQSLTNSFLEGDVDNAVWAECGENGGENPNFLDFFLAEKVCVDHDG